MTNSPSSISLSTSCLALIGRRTSDAGWYEFDAVIGGVRCEHIGGQSLSTLAEQLSSVLKKEHGTPLSQLKNPTFSRELGGLNAEYLGYVVFSGYNTIYFFLKAGGAMHALLANGEGTPIAHTPIPAGLREAWLPVLRAHLQHGQ